MTPKYLTPPHFLGQQQDYRRGIDQAFSLWLSAIVPAIRSSLTGYRDNWADDLREEMQENWDLVLIALLALMRRTVVQINVRQESWWIEVVARVTGQSPEVIASILRNREPWLPGEIQSQINFNADALRNLGAYAVLRVWETISEAISNVVPVAEIIRRVREAVTRISRVAQNSAATRIFRFGSDLNQRRQSDAGVRRYVWMETSSLHPRRHHLERVGRIFYYDNPPADGHPGTQPNCKCGAAPVFGDEIYGFSVRNPYRAA